VHQTGDAVEAQRVYLLAHGVCRLNIHRAFATGLDLNLTGYQRILTLAEGRLDLIVAQYLAVNLQVRCAAMLQNAVIG
jgi:hypothetical protein